MQKITPLKDERINIIKKEITPGTDVSLHIINGTGGYFCSVLLSNFIWSTSLSAEWLSSLFLALHSCFRFIFFIKLFGFLYLSIYSCKAVMKILVITCTSVSHFPFCD